MNITELLVTEEIEDKLYAKHRVSVDELYEVIWNDEDQVMLRHSQKVRGTYTAYGRTLAGRYLMIAFRLLEGGIAKVLTARDMDMAERQLYRG